MYRRSLGYRAIFGIFVGTSIITFFLLRESEIRSSSDEQSPFLNSLFREISKDALQIGRKYYNIERKNPQEHFQLQQRDKGNPVKTKKCAPDSPRYVILLTYGRSGSTLISDIISEHPDVFTYFEPLFDLAKSFRRKQTKYFAENNKYLHLTEIEEYNSGALHILGQQMTCNYHRLSRFASLNKHAPDVNSTKSLYNCVKRALTTKAETTCLLEAQEKCQQKPVRFIKTIRLSVKTASVLLDAYPCSKLIYLIRDPRGSYHSKTATFAIYQQNLGFDAQRFCTRLKKDADAVFKLKEKYPDRIHLTRFENIAAHPIVSMKDIYEFIDLEFTQSIAKFVYQKTHSKTAGEGYSTDRADPLETCHKWRQTIPFEQVTVFDKFCSEPNFKLGYLPVNSLQDLRNLSRTLICHRDNFS